MTFFRITVEDRYCECCGKSTLRRVLGDDFLDLYIECVECESKELYDGEPISLIEQGVFR